MYFSIFYVPSYGSVIDEQIIFLERHENIFQSAILMALLATNYIHLCKETLWLFANIVNNESVVVQEQLVEQDLMDKLEYHTVQAVQKLDPYALLNI